MVVPLEDVIVEQPGDGVAVVSFSGEHDLATSSQVRALLESLIGQSTLVVADFSHARFVDSSLLHTLIAANGLARAQGTSFRIRVGTLAIVKRTFEISGILEQIAYASSDEPALNGREPTDGHPMEASDGRRA